MDTTTKNLRAWALHFAARGWHVFPIAPSVKKPPMIDRWETRASTDLDQIRYWWRHIPHTIGIATGPSRPVDIAHRFDQTVHVAPQRDEATHRAGYVRFSSIVDGS